MKKALLFLISLAMCGGAFAQDVGTPSPQQTVTFRFVPGDDMFYVREKEGMGDNARQLETLYALIDSCRPQILSGEIPIRVDAYSASAKSQRANRNLSFVRANRVKSELIVHKGVSEDNFITRNFATSHTDPQGTVHKDLVVVTLRIPAKPEPAPEPAVCPPPVVVEEAPPVEEAPFTPVESQPEPLATSRSEHAGLYLRTNLLYDALLTPTLGLEWRINDHAGIRVDASWAHWGSSKGRVQKIWLVNPEVRWYLLDAKKFYLGLGANFGEANIYRGLAKVISKDTGYQGNFYGAGITIGYQLGLCRCLSLDFNLGLGMTHFSYDTFTVSNGVRVYGKRDLTRNLWGPTQAGVSLVWKICGGK